MLAATPAPTSRTIWEPFNLRARQGVRQAPFRYWFTYVTNRNAAEFGPPLERMLEWRYSIAAEIPTLRTPKDAGRMIRDRWVVGSNRRARAVPIVKDPIAVFSAEWMSDAFDMDALVLVRHPAAFVYSIVKQGWWHPFDHFTAQPAMMRELFADRTDEIERFAPQPQPLLDQAILLWTLIHEHIADMRARRPTWRFVRHEDLSRDPVRGFRELFDWLGLSGATTCNGRSSTARVSRTRTSRPWRPIANATARPRSASGRIGLRPRSEATIEERTAPVWREFYGEADW